MKRNIGLGYKFISFTTILIISVASFYSFYLINHERNLLNDQLKKRGVSITNWLANNCQYGVLTEDKIILTRFIKSAILEKDVVYVGITDADGKFIANNSADKISRYLKKPKGPVKDIKIDLIKGKLIYDIVAPIVLEPEGQIGAVTEVGAQAKPSLEIIGFVNIGITTENLNLELAQIKRKIVVITVFITVIALGISLFFSNRIVRPVKELLFITQKVGEGDLTQKARIISSDEIGDLADAFNNMTDELKVSRDKIENYSRTLEQRIKERTKELEEANKELRETQAQLIQSAKMTAIGQLGAGIAHELNNPMGGIMGYAQFMLQKIAKPNFGAEDFTTCKKYLQHIEIEAQRCKAIVESLLNFSRRTKEVKPLNIKDVIEDTLIIMAHQLTLQNIEIVKQYEEHLAQVEGNPNQLQQVFTNIILNASQAMPKGGELRIAAENILDGEGRAKEVEIRFTDTGCGIAPEHLSKIFDPFFTTKMDWKGTGLGLSISYEIIESHKGKILAVSDGPGKGATFIVKLPVLKG